MRVYDKDLRVIATSDPGSQDKVGQRTTDIVVTRTFVTEEMIEKCLLTNQRMNGSGYCTSWSKSIMKLKDPIHWRENWKGFWTNSSHQPSSHKWNDNCPSLYSHCCSHHCSNNYKTDHRYEKQAQAMARGNYSRKVKSIRSWWNWPISHYF